MGTPLLLLRFPRGGQGKPGWQSLWEGARPETTEKDFGSHERRNLGGEEAQSLASPQHPRLGIQPSATPCQAPLRCVREPTSQP